MEAPLQISTHSVLPVVGAELTEVLNQELSALFDDAEIDATTVESEPPASGLSEIAYTILATGAAGMLVKFFEPLLTTAGEAFRDKLLELIRDHRRSSASGRGYIPLRIAVGETYPLTPVRYYVQGRLDEEELLKRLQAADEHLRTIPPELLRGSGGPPENGFFWDEGQQRWRGTIWRGGAPPYGEFWLPPGILDPRD